MCNRRTTLSINFNPRSHTGSDCSLGFFVVLLTRFQSTLPHGERPQDATFPNCGIPFQSTLPHGERLAGQPGILILSVFQSTLPHGERPGSVFACPPTTNFNPRSHTGSDFVEYAPSKRNSNFNPRSHTGSDEMCDYMIEVIHISIHAPTRGAT